MQSIENLKTWVYIWYAFFVFGTGVSVGYGVIRPPSGDFSPVGFLMGVAGGLLAGIPVLAIFSLLVRNFGLQEQALAATARHNNVLIERLDTLISATLGVENVPAPASDPTLASSVSSDISESPSPDLGAASHLIYRQPATENERVENTRPFPQV